MTPDNVFQTRLQRVRGHYHATPWIQPREDESALLRSWQRCRDAGMREEERVSFELVSRSMLATLDEAHGALVRAARPETERLARALRGTGCVVLLFNTRGVVIDRLCHEAATPASLLTATRNGVNVAERCVGTTAPGISIADGLPSLVGRDAHFFSNMRAFFCVAAPIDAPDGQRLGALDITCYDSVPSFDVFSLVVDAAAAVENSLFQPGPGMLVVHFHPRAEWVGTSMEGLLAVKPDGTVCAANRSAARLLGVPRAALIGRPFSALFDRRLQAVFARPAGPRGDLVEMLSHTGLQVLARFEGEPRRTQVAAAWPAADGPAAAGPTSPADPAALPLAQPARMHDLERQAIEQALAALGGNVSAAARQLGISRNTIYRRRGSLG